MGIFIIFYVKVYIQKSKCLNLTDFLFRIKVTHFYIVPIRNHHTEFEIDKTIQTK